MSMDLVTSLVPATRSWQRARRPSGPCPKAGPLTSQARRSSSASCSPKARELVRRGSSSCFSGIPRNLKSHALAARASASRNSTPSALCIRKCTARISSMVQSGMGSTTSTAQAATSCPASRARFMAVRISRTAIRRAVTRPCLTRSRASPAVKRSAA